MEAGVRTDEVAERGHSPQLSVEETTDTRPSKELDADAMEPLFEKLADDEESKSAQGGL